MCFLLFVHFFGLLSAPRFLSDLGQLTSRKPVAFVVSYLENLQGRLLDNTMISVWRRIHLVKEAAYVDLGLHPPFWNSSRLKLNANDGSINKSEQRIPKTKNMEVQSCHRHSILFITITVELIISKRHNQNHNSRWIKYYFIILISRRIILKNHGSRLLMKSPFTRKKTQAISHFMGKNLGHLRITKMPFPTSSQLCERWDLVSVCQWAC